MNSQDIQLDNLINSLPIEERKQKMYYKEALGTFWKNSFWGYEIEFLKTYHKELQPTFIYTGVQKQQERINYERDSTALHNLEREIKEIETRQNGLNDLQTKRNELKNKLDK